MPTSSAGKHGCVAQGSKSPQAANNQNSTAPPHKTAQHPTLANAQHPDPTPIAQQPHPARISTKSGQAGPFLHQQQRTRFRTCEGVQQQHTTRTAHRWRQIVGRNFRPQTIFFEKDCLREGRGGSLFSAQMSGTRKQSFSKKIVFPKRLCTSHSKQSFLR